jgi:FKBP-type peptidyl-prolyl cis-trans isomerase
LCVATLDTPICPAKNPPPNAEPIAGNAVVIELLAALGALVPAAFVAVTVAFNVVFDPSLIAILAAEKEAGRVNREKGEAFLIENAKKKEIQVTASGLQYEVLKKGRGSKPTASSTVKVHYTGTNIDGQIFDSSVERKEPISFPLNAVIPGWTEGVQLMSVGSKYRFYIPQELAYGPGSPTELIPPYSVLIFEVELLDIEK